MLCAMQWIQTKMQQQTQEWEKCSAIRYRYRLRYSLMSWHCVLHWNVCLATIFIRFRFRSLCFLIFLVHFASYWWHNGADCVASHCACMRLHIKQCSGNNYRPAIASISPLVEVEWHMCTFVNLRPVFLLAPHRRRIGKWKTFVFMHQEQNMNLINKTSSCDDCVYFMYGIGYLLCTSNWLGCLFIYCFSLARFCFIFFGDATGCNAVIAGLMPRGF